MGDGSAHIGSVGTSGDTPYYNGGTGIAAIQVGSSKSRMPELADYEISPEKRISVCFRHPVDHFKQS